MYTSKSLIEKFLGVSIAAELDTYLNMLISATQAYIENYCGDDEFGKRVFEAPTIPEGETEPDKIRYFDGNGQKRIFIGEAVSVSSLNLDNNEQILNQDFYLKPYNAADIGRPFDYIELVQPSGNWSSRAKAIYDFTSDQRNIKVTGKFRYSNVAPSDIQLIATQIAGSLMGEALSDGIKAETLDDYRVEYASVSKKATTLGSNDILNNYKRKVPTVNCGTFVAS